MRGCGTTLVRSISRNDTVLPEGSPTPKSPKFSVCAGEEATLHCCIAYEQRCSRSFQTEWLSSRHIQPPPPLSSCFHCVVSLLPPRFQNKSIKKTTSGVTDARVYIRIMKLPHTMPFTINLNSDLFHFLFLRTRSLFVWSWTRTKSTTCWRRWPTSRRASTASSTTRSRTLLCGTETVPVPADRLRAGCLAVSWLHIQTVGPTGRHCVIVFDHLERDEDSATRDIKGAECGPKWIFV